VRWSLRDRVRGDSPKPEEEGDMGTRCRGYAGALKDSANVVRRDVTLGVRASDRLKMPATRESYIAGAVSDGSIAPKSLSG